MKKMRERGGRGNEIPFLDVSFLKIRGGSRPLGSRRGKGGGRSKRTSKEVSLGA